MTHARPPALWVMPVILALLSWAWYRLYALDLVQSGSWGCEMSWMTPSYVKIDTPDSPIPRYSLYLYRENGWDLDQELSGHPVIFIPGNAGSYQQVRSIASSVSRQYYGQPGQRAEDLLNASKIDMFTLDLNEDFSAFHPQLIRDQAGYLIHVVDYISRVYGAGSRITLVGHSMGGIVAQLATRMNQTVDRLVDIIITMSTPHIYPPVTLDQDFLRIYNEISSDISPVLVNICGGAADTQIASDACAVSLEPTQGLTVFATAIPGVWTGVDHQAMVWCHQIRWVVARLLLESTLSEALPDKLETARQWLLVGYSAEIVRSPPRRFEVAGDTTFLLDSPPSDVVACTNSGCHPIKHHVQPFPHLRSGSPFPLPGEGVKREDMRFALTLNWTGLVAFEITGEVVSGAYSRNQPSRGDGSLQLPPVTHYRLDYPTSTSHSLAVYRLRIGLESCSGPVPAVKFTTNAASNAVEQQFYSADAPYILLHPHVARSPFLSPGQARGMRIDIYQSLSCPVTEVTMEFELWRSLAKAVTRYRMAALAWTLGWTAVLFDLCVQQTETTAFIPAWWTLSGRHRFMHVLTVLMALSIAMTAFGSKLSAHLLLGVNEIEFTIAALALSCWTLFLVTTLHIMLQTLRSTWHKLRAASAPADPMQSQYHALFFCALCLVIGIWVPYELLLALLTIVQVLTLGTGNSDLSVAILLLSLALSPFHITRSIGWIRAAAMDRAHAPSMTHNPMNSMPSIALFALRYNRPRESPRLRVLCSWSFKALAATCFLVGPRHTYALPWIARGAMLTLCMLLWPSKRAAGSHL